jgi:hypothetical protein
MKTFLIEINGEYAYVEADSEKEATVILHRTYGFKKSEFTVYHEVDSEYAEMTGLDTY